MREREIFARFVFFVTNIRTFWCIFYWHKYCSSVPKMTNIRLMIGHLGAIASESVVMFFAGGARAQTGRHCSTTPEWCCLWSILKRIFWKPKHYQYWTQYQYQPLIDVVQDQYWNQNLTDDWWNKALWKSSMAYIWWWNWVVCWVLNFEEFECRNNDGTNPSDELVVFGHRPPCSAFPCEK